MRRLVDAAGKARDDDEALGEDPVNVDQDAESASEMLSRYSDDGGGQSQVERAASTPQGRLLALFDVAEVWFCGDRFYGCMFVNAIAEYSNRQSAIRTACQEFKQLLRGYVQELAEQAAAKDPATLADELALLLEGATVTAQVSAQPEAAKTARRVAALLITQATSR
jgi:hypothetical protein